MTNRIKILSESRAMLASIQNAGDVERTKAIDEAVAEVASVDGDKVLDQFEAEAVKTVFESVAPVGTQMDAAKVGEVKSALATRIAELKSERVKATEVLFTSEGDAIKTFRAKIIGGIEEAIDKADGKPVDVNMMVFAFTDKVIADKIIEMAEANPNVTFRLITDWGQMATSGGRQPARLAKYAEENDLQNLKIKFKKDNPYTWSASAGRPVYSHAHTTGLNHHKGFVTLIDGRPEKMVMGSFNWSVGGMKSNYENIMVLDRADPDNRRILDGYEAEFTDFWNNDDVALLYNEARKAKDEAYASVHEANGSTYNRRSYPTDSIEDPDYAAVDNTAFFDINSFSDKGAEKLEVLVGKSMAKKINKELRDYGRFDSWTEMLARVPDLANIGTWEREQLMENLEFGTGGLSINTASLEELDRAGLTKRQAEKVVAFRQDHGAFESLAELDDVAGIGPKTIERIGLVMNADEVIGTYSAKVPGEDATTGWSDTHHGTMAVPSAGDDGSGDTVKDVVPANRAELEEVERNLAAPVIDMLRRTKPGETFRIAMYGMSTSSPEYKALKEAAERGVPIRAVLYKSYNAKAIKALQDLKDVDGHDVEVKILSSRVMHEKFGVAGDDVFNGSSNWSTSSITKHSEDRFLFRNQPRLADRFVEEFARLWDKAKDPT
jgi:competence ComEA-like helix-hairpin-helix protein